MELEELRRKNIAIYRQRIKQQQEQEHEIYRQQHARHIQILWILALGFCAGLVYFFSVFQ